MDAKSKLKKEVSCKVLRPYFFLLNQKNIEIAKILEGIPYDASYLLRKSERIEWEVYCKIIHNLRSFFSPLEFEKVGEIHVNKGFYPEGIIAGFIFFSSNRFSRMLTKRIIRMGQHMFSCIRSEVQYIDKNHIRLIASVKDEYEFVPEFALLTRGGWLYIGNLIGHKEFNVNLTWITKGVIFDISWEKEGFIFKIKRRVHWLFSVRRAYLDLTDSHEELLNQYNKLEESEIILQRQTAQLKTAHVITKSIKQSLDIWKTLNGITNALVNNAGFSLAHIKLYKDMEGNDLKIETLSGIKEININPINRSIVIENENIGELIVYPQMGEETSELEKMLNYLLPIIDISIHDSLVLRTVTDYKKNLETKVEKRTSELKKARDELSETIDLLRDAQQAQNRFFTNISHEFRTPLTLILGPVKQIIEKIKEDISGPDVIYVKDELKVVQKNANKLLSLVNQLLDISKLESGNMRLLTCRQNIIHILKALLQSFCSYAERKKIHLVFSAKMEKLILYVDREKIEKVIANILSNALKFTPEEGEIEVSASLMKERFVEISIRDTGIGIPEEKLPKIFDRFYQVDGSHTREQEGTGIGLSLTKELVELHKGKIGVESEEGKGTVFTISLPLGKEHLKPEEICGEEKDKIHDISREPFYIDEDKINASVHLKGKQYHHLIPDNPSDKKVKPVLLLVEDNSDVRNYIKNNLINYYKVLESIDGEDGWNKAVEIIPDLIVSDVMMPKMDGFELCKKLKTDERTSHIPVILLTAKASGKDKIDGFETGADEYLMKPFEPDELKARIKNLIEQRKRLHEYFRKHGIIELEESMIDSIDKSFFEHVIEKITENISDSSFNVRYLSETLPVSYSVLRKKIVALTGDLPVELIRRVRLTKASELIKKGFGNISEIALEVGFNNPAYFSECFKKQFGVSPSKYSGNKL